MYTPDNVESFANDVKLQIENELCKIKGFCQVDSDTITIDKRLVIDSINSSKRDHTYDDDSLYYENYIYGVIVSDLLFKLFTAMFKFSYTPTAMKRDIIITLYKGEKKKKLTQTVIGQSHCRR